jgi:hypothetical protein
MKIYIISNRHRKIKVIFYQPQLRWSVEHGEAVHRYYIQHVIQNLYKETKRAGQRENNLKDDFKRRLVNKKKSHYFIER